jgi:hypothetical protein
MCNFDKTKFMIFQNGGKLKSRECWYMNRQKLEEVNEIAYLGMTLEKMGEWKSHKENVKAKVRHYNTILLTPWCRVLLEKLPGLQLVKKFPAFHGT